MSVLYVLHIYSSSLWLVFKEIICFVICDMQVFNFSHLICVLVCLCIQEIPLYPEVSKMVTCFP